MDKMLVNGRVQHTIDAEDRGVHYGDGLFETMAVRHGLPLLWDRHWRRLAQGCERLAIRGVTEADLRDDATRVCEAVEQGVLKVIITRGKGGRGYRPPREGAATRVVATYPWPDYPEAHSLDGVAVRICTTRLGRNPALAGLKHLNRLEQVLARREWDDPAIAEGLMCDDDGHVISGTMSNLFTISGGKLITPLLKECGVAGVMRGLIIDLAVESAIPWEEEVMALHALRQADEVFLCNALIGIWPVRRIERQNYAIGPVTRLLSDRLTALRRQSNRGVG